MGRDEVTAETKTPEEMLEAMRTAYAARLGDRFAELKLTADLVVEGEASNDRMDALTDLRTQAHRLAGSAGTYGFPDLGDAARKLELFCQPFVENTSSPSSRDSVEIMELVEALIQYHEQHPNTDPKDTPTIRKRVRPGDEEFNADQTILLVEDDPEQSARLKIGLGALAYDVQVIDDPENIKEAIDSYQPAAILLDLGFEKGRTADAETIQMIRSSIGVRCPLIVLTVHDDFEARLASVRAGCDQFLTKPVTLDEIVQVLEALTAPHKKEPERVLIVDDDTDILEFVKGTLRSASMMVETLSDPALTSEIIGDFVPEIILLDLQMPKCNGKELAAIIRQQPEHAAIPIVYLSAETDKDAQFDAMGVGADDFLTKPINPRHLIAAVRSRATRFRVLRDLMSRDSLTGLYNHGTTWQLFEVELSRASRSGVPVSFAMLDIDHFKAVNDTFGHGVGDTVLRALSKVLTHRLRMGDIIGRLGGEEFGVVLPATTADQAHSIMETVRLSFAEISQGAAGSDAPITLSSGIATFPEYEFAAELAEAADQALYEAKNAGRNNTVIASPPDLVEHSDAGLAVDREQADNQLQLVEGSAEASEVAAPSGKSEMRPRNKDLMVVDDDPMIGEFIKPFAEKAGFNVQIVTDPTLFATTYRAKTDLIMLDLNMPFMDGIELLRFLGDNRSETAIVIVSGYDMEIISAARNLAKKQDLNIIDALQKPLDQRELERVLAEAYENSGNKMRRAARQGTSDMPTVEELRDAIANNMLEVYYQPKVKLPGESVLGAEALVRWNHPTKGFISPELFVVLAEQNELIGDLTDFVLNEACGQIKRSRKLGQELVISVNMSDRSFEDLNFPEQISDIVTAAGLSSSDILLELTETSLSSDVTHVMDILTRLRLRGFEISIDDFGTGHSSLSRLNEMPFNELKIDKSFVGRAHTEPGARAIVKNTVELARSLNLKTVAEGAEMQEHIDMLNEYGCDYVQGYFFSRPLPPKEFEEWLEEQKYDSC